MLTSIYLLIGLAMLLSCAMQSDATNLTDNFNITISPPSGIKITLNDESAINFTVILKEPLTCQDLRMKIYIDNPDIYLTNLTSTVLFDALDPTSLENCSTTLAVVGYQVGMGYLSAQVTTSQSSEVIWNSTYVITIVRTNTILAFAAKIGILVSLAMSTMAYGCELNVTSIKQCLRRPVGIGIGYVCQFGLMPVLAYALGVGLKLPSNMAFGLLAVGCSPGGGISNMYSALLDGDLNMSIIMTFLSIITSIGITPLWLIFLGGHILHKDYPEAKVMFPWGYVTMAVAILTVPCFIGVIIRSYVSEKLARLIQIILRPISTIVVTVSVAITIEEYAWVTGFMNTWEIFIACAGLPYIGFGASLVIALLLRQTWKASVTIMVETGIQNLLIAFMIIEPSLPVPYGSIAWTIPSLVLLLTFIPLLVVIFVAILKRVATQEPDQKYSPEKFIEDLEKNGSASIDNTALSNASDSTIIVSTPKLKLRQTE